jgi:hypothetical protein
VWARVNQLMSNRDDDYLALFGGAKISKRESNKAGLALIIGFIALAITIFIFRLENDMIVLSISILSAMAGYFLIADRIFKKKA